MGSSVKASIARIATEKPIGKQPLTLRLDDDFSDYAIAARALDQLIDAPRERYDPTDVADDRVLGWELPHHGAAPANKHCGSIGFRGHFHTQSKLHYQAYDNDCGTFRCPTCRSTLDGDNITPKGYEKRGGMAIADRLEHCQPLFDLGAMPQHPRSYTKGPARHGQAANIYHVIISPPQEWAKNQMGTKTGIRELWNQAFKVAQSRGVIGGAAIFHPLRIPSKWNKRSGCSGGPHWHILGFTHWGDAYDGNVCSVLNQGGETRRRAVKRQLIDLGMATRDTDHVAGDGWIVKVKDARTRNVFRTAAYCLSHAGRPVVLDPAGHARRHARAAGVTRASARDDPEAAMLWHQIEKKAKETGYLPPFIRDFEPDEPRYIHPLTMKPEPGLDLDPDGDAEGGAYPALPRGTRRVPSGRVERSTKGYGHVVRWFGVCSYNKIPRHETESCGILCDICEKEVPSEEWYRIEWQGRAGVLPPPNRAGAAGVSPINNWAIFEKPWSVAPLPYSLEDHDDDEHDNLAGVWKDGLFYPDAPSKCPCCESLAALAPETTDATMRILTGSGNLVCAACGVVRGHVDHLLPDSSLSLFPQDTVMS